MRQYFSILVLLGTLMLGSVSWADEPLKGGVQWTEDTARVEALKNIEYQLDTQDISAQDPNFKENIQFKEGEVAKVANRRLTYFRDGYYAVAYDGERTVHYYDPEGKLFKVSVCSATFGPAASYPRKCVEYAYPKGKFITVSLDVAPEESFIFNPKGEFLHHWVGTRQLDKAGQPVDDDERW